MSSFFNAAKNDSAIALSQQIPVRPIEPTILCLLRWAANWTLVYCVQCRLVKRVVGGPAGWFGGCIAVDGVRASWLENCDGYLFSRPGDRFWVGVCSAARGFPRCLAHVVCVALWGENTAGSVIRRRRMCSVRVKDNRSGSISTVSAASDMKARIA